MPILTHAIHFKIVTPRHEHHDSSPCCLLCVEIPSKMTGTCSMMFGTEHDCKQDCQQDYEQDYQQLCIQQI